MTTPADVAPPTSDPHLRAAGAPELAKRFLALDARSAAFVGAAIVFLIGVPLALAQSIWIDEGFTLRTTGAGPLTAWARALAFEDQPPLYFLLEALWRMFDESSIGFARLPSVFFASAAVAVLVNAARRIMPAVPPLVVALVCAFNPFVLWAATEMRVYPLVLLISAVLVFAFHDGFLVERPSRRAQICYVLFAIAGLYTQFFVGFLLAAQGITLLFLRRRAIPLFAVAAIVIAAGFAPFVPFALIDMRASGEFVLHPTLLQALREVVSGLFVIVLPHDEQWNGLVRLLGVGASAALFIALIVVGRPSARSAQARGVVLQWALCGIFLGVVFSVTGVPLGALKYLTVLAPSTLLVALLFVSSLRRFQATAAKVALGMYGMLALATLIDHYRPPFLKPGDWPRIAMTILQGNPSTPVVVFPAELAQALKWYLPEPIIELPRPMPFTLTYVRDMTLSNEAEVARSLEAVRAPAGEIWLVTTDDCGPGIAGYYDYHCGLLENYVKRRYRVVKSIAFNGSLARLLLRVPTGQTDLLTVRHT